ncbi:MAG: tRNA-(ms[2]io[6]A)-hydroxylase [Myxococcota bacterium]|jgi:tRNA-(ms[2]io[6]A)-hydroxylase|nr:tRNA-(ms[2]io[6]A)-hydroxylase [Myxococcota bacterium]
MLNLASETPPSWTERACGALDEILLDHAHCEKKAAGGALRLLFSYPNQVFLQRPLADLAQEELTHFQQLLDILDARDIPFERQKPSPYAGKLHALVKPREPRRLTDLLLVCALIEARSCERMKCLSEAPIDAELQTFYKDLLASEARHHQLYVELACQVEPAETVRERLRELAEIEAGILAEGGPDVRLHS